ncbi:MAG: TonB-dependent receptor, partial [Cyclobacteriaceae bacterium]|nr:TonB-dependent receptor [Cyclobacteriaceae bacterium]
MKYLFLALFAAYTFFLSVGLSKAQTQSQLRGIVLDRENSLPLPGASVFWENDRSTGVVSGLDGSFSIPVSELPAFLKLSFVG